MIAPRIAGILTAWKVNLGNASRAPWSWSLNWSAPPAGGHQLLRKQQLFDMAGALA